MYPLQRPWPFPTADAGIRLPGSGPCERRDIRDVQGPEPAGNLKILITDITVSSHFTYILSRVLCPVPCLHFYCSSAWKLRKVHGVQKASL
ncbi:unnamed protein product [Staurois parvus]|uniref:Uncharacterized protein n=1 Tax=Staurois parvus TaxID=386267 RepID=A0ABN9C9K3_9NEOB|nr:unnamed protein product [Staurois parvus]